MDGSAKNLNVRQAVRVHLQALVNVLTSSDEIRRSVAAAYATHVFKASVLRRLVKALADTLPYGGSVARQATASLADIGQPTIPELISRVKKSQDLGECVGLIDTLGEIGAKIGTSEKIDLFFQLENLRDTAQHPAIAAALDRAMHRLWKAGSGGPAEHPGQDVETGSEHAFPVT